MLAQSPVRLIAGASNPTPAGQQTRPEATRLDPQDFMRESEHPDVWKILRIVRRNLAS
jgi:hypothetical protein